MPSGAVHLRVTVPDNVTATVELPATPDSYQTTGAGDPRSVGTQDGREVFTVGSGTTQFVPQGG